MQVAYMDKVLQALQKVRPWFLPCCERGSLVKTPAETSWLQMTNVKTHFVRTEL